MSASIEILLLVRRQVGFHPGAGPALNSRLLLRGRGRGERGWRVCWRAGFEPVLDQYRSEVRMSPPVVGDLLDKILHHWAADLLELSDHLCGLRANCSQILACGSPLPKQVNVEGAADYDDQNH